MKKVIQHRVIAAAALASQLFLGQAFAAGTSGAQFLKLGAGARAAAMGDAYVAVSNDVTGAYYNPAGVAQIETPEIAVMQNIYLEDTNYQYAAGAMPVGKSVMALSLYRMDYGAIEKYTASNAKDGSFNAGSLAAAITWSKQINDNLSLGFSGKYLEDSIESEKATSFAGDIGALYKKNDVNFGFAVQHLGPAMKMVKESSPLPQTIRAGVSKTFIDEKLLMSLDISKPNDNGASVSAGAEYKLGDIVKFRGGYKLSPNQSELGGLTGVNGGLGITVNRLNFDYSVTPFGDLGISHKISILVRFGQASTKSSSTYSTPSYKSYRAYR